ncbi:Metal homeostatis protein BSD2 [Termitomyces sp. J132]|nr:hypothetical protein C0989_009502 [Termitomyces sp. Mn162]KAH0585091.1 hypothetical protein H2248_008352 [Termitomyces sp. 'cryptogamus']KNZ79224.1 Metal homeostatis protein BSD2 [Termitomyces sp. J132]
MPITHLPRSGRRVPSSDASSSRIISAGTENDDVFANVVAKPQQAQPQVAADGTIIVAPEETTQRDVPLVPSPESIIFFITYYSRSPTQTPQPTQSPPTSKTTIHAPFTDPDGPMIIEDLPTGSPWLSFTNLFISFQFVGFLLTYLLHTSHAAKYGSSLRGDPVIDRQGKAHWN